MIFPLSAKEHYTLDATFRLQQIPRSKSKATTVWANRFSSVFFVSRNGFLRRQLCSVAYLGCACTVPDVCIAAELRKFEKKVLFSGCRSLGDNVGYCACALSSSYTTGCTAARVSALLLQARLSGTQSAAIGACASLACIDCCCFGVALTFVSMLCRVEKKRPLLFV
jgi:hypothetical protein